MSLLRKASTPIAPESARLLREAMRARRKGFSQVANELAMRSFEQKGMEPTIWKSGERQAMADLKTSLANAEIQKSQEAAQMQNEGRKSFANQIKKTAKENPEEAYGIAQQEAPKYGVTSSQLANFFERNKLPVKLNLYRPDEVKKTESKVQGASGIQGANGLSRK